MFFFLAPKEAMINDISPNLMAFYSYVKSNDQEFRLFLNEYASVLDGFLDLCDRNYPILYDLYAAAKDNRLSPDEQRLKISDFLQTHHEKYQSPIILDFNAFLNRTVEMVTDKIRRTVLNEKRSPFCSEDLKENLITGFVSGLYMYFRDIYNDLSLGRNTSVSEQYRAANFYFIREYCYGSMFRYNKRGEFNIPYGGMSYNRKDFRAKIEHMFSQEVQALFEHTVVSCSDFEDFLTDADLTENDFIFLDPPYDTEFSDYEGKAFTKHDQARLARFLEKTRAKFILIIKNTDYIYSLYQGKHNILCFDKTYTYNVRSRNDRNAEHLIITNLCV